MDLGSIVLVAEILLLVAGWLLFQHAKMELTARAAQLPVLSEMKDLQKSIAGLIEQLKLEAGQSSAQLEARCVEARDLLNALDRRLEESRQPTTASRATRKRNTTTAPPDSPGRLPDGAQPSVTPPAEPAASDRYREVYTLADEGLAAPAIARQTGIPQGEVELILGLRRASPG